MRLSNPEDGAVDFWEPHNEAFPLGWGYFDKFLNRDASGLAGAVPIFFRFYDASP